MDEIKSKKQKHTQNLPYDIIENILSRLPVKSLLRFKAVSKQWESTISDPKFAEIHLRQSKNSSSRRNLHAGEADSEFRRFHAVKQVEIFHYCDGLFLKRYCTFENKTFLLWNPSSRRHKTFHCPYPIGNGFQTCYGICYDPLVKDYKVVVTDMKHYALFYCRNNRWTELRQIKEFSCGRVVQQRMGASFNGSVYWPVTTARVEDGSHEFEIFCFDGREEKFKKLPLLDCDRKANCSRLASVGMHLFLFPSKVYKPRGKISIMRKDGDDLSWTEFKVQLPISYRYVDVFGFMDENEILLDVGDPKNYVIYNLSKKTFADIQRTSITRYSRPLPYLENLHFV